MGHNAIKQNDQVTAASITLLPVLEDKSLGPAMVLVRFVLGRYAKREINQYLPELKTNMCLEQEVNRPNYTKTLAKPLGSHHDDRQETTTDAHEERHAVLR